MENKSIVEYVANLARIEISQEEKETLNKQIADILNYIDKLKELDIEGIEPMRGLHTDRNVFRDDQVEDFPFKGDILNNAPSSEGKYFKIPKVIE
jgi:aspartyl-tRNA(Asn)/glutamyl-tRNA(Gln) amidotransferase subunit C